MLTEQYHLLVNHTLSRTSLEVRFLSAQSVPVWVHISFSVVRDETGKFAYSIAVIHDITERRRIIAEEHAQRTLAEALAETTLALTGTLDFEKVLDQILLIIGRIFSQVGASIWLSDAENFTLVRERGHPEKVIPELIVAIEQLIIPDAKSTVFEVVADTKQPVILSELAFEADTKTAPEIQAIRSLICVPIIAHEEVIGCLELHSSTAHFFTQQQGALLQTFAAGAAVAIQNARAHHQAQLLVAHEERQRLARDLHDSVTQLLFSASITAESLLRVGQTMPERFQARLGELHLLTRGALAEMRHLLVELRPESLLKTPLSAQLRQFADALKSRRKGEVKVSIIENMTLPDDVHLAFYRMTQEILNNIVNHSNASQVEIEYDATPGRVILAIRDNGAGFAPEQESAGIGLNSIRERARHIHASLEISSSIGQGTRIRVTWVPGQKE